MREKSSKTKSVIFLIVGIFLVVAVLVYFLLFSGRRIKYNNNGGSGCTTTKISSNGSIDELCVPKRKGYAFVGWYSSNYASNP